MLSTHWLIYLSDKLVVDLLARILSAMSIA